MSTGIIHKRVHAPTCQYYGRPSRPHLRRRPPPMLGKRYAPGETAILREDTFSSPGDAKYAPEYQAEASHAQLQTVVCATVYLIDRQCCQHRDCSREGTCLPLISPATDFCANRGISAGTDALMSSRAFNVSLEDCAMEIMEEEACRRSRYRSLRFHIRVPVNHIVEYTGTHPTMSRSSSCLTSASVLSHAA
jgi:hypothetical protein